jgi:hypothetical protein
MQLVRVGPKMAMHGQLASADFLSPSALEHHSLLWYACSSCHCILCLLAGATWPSSLQRLSLARNPNLSGALSNPPPSVTYLDISGTGITGTLPLPAAMPNLTCLLVRDSAMLCGSVANDMPCSVSSAAGMSGTNLLKDCATNATLSGPTSCSGQPPDCDAGATQAANLIQWIGGRNASAAAALGWSGYDACSGPGWGNVGCEDGVIRSLQLADMGLAGTLGTLLDDMNTLRVSSMEPCSHGVAMPAVWSLYHT